MLNKTKFQAIRFLFLFLFFRIFWGTSVHAEDYFLKLGLTKKLLALTLASSGKPLNPIVLRELRQIGISLRAIKNITELKKGLSFEELESAIESMQSKRLNTTKILSVRDPQLLNYIVFNSSISRVSRFLNLGREGIYKLEFVFLPADSKTEAKITLRKIQSSDYPKYSVGYWIKGNCHYQDVSGNSLIKNHFALLKLLLIAQDQNISVPWQYFYNENLLPLIDPLLNKYFGADFNSEPAEFGELYLPKTREVTTQKLSELLKELRSHCARSLKG